MGITAEGPAAGSGAGLPADPRRAAGGRHGDGAALVLVTGSNVSA
jgi:hypothetical protein